MTDPDDLERRLRDALAARAAAADPRPGPWSRRRATRPRSSRWALPALAAAVVAIVVVLVTAGLAGRGNNRTAGPATVLPDPTPTATAVSPRPAEPAVTVPGGAGGSSSAATATRPEPTSEPVLSTDTVAGPTAPTASAGSGAPTSPVPSRSPLSGVTVTSFLRPTCPSGILHAETVECPQEPQVTFSADGPTTRAASGFGLSDVGPGGATVSMTDTGDGSLSLTNGSVTTRVPATGGPLVFVGATPLAAGTGVWGVVGGTVTTVEVSGPGSAPSVRPLLYAVGGRFGFLSGTLDLPATVRGLDASGAVLFSVVVPG